MSRLGVCLFAGIAAVSLSGLSAQAGIVFGASSYDPAFSFAGDPAAGCCVPIGPAFDGTNFYTGGGNFNGAPAAIYDSAGNLINSAGSNGLDFRALFTDGSNNVLARSFNDPTIYIQTSFANFTPFVTLTGAGLDSQAGVAFDQTRNLYIVNSTDGSLGVQEFDTAGNYQGSVTLNGFGPGYPNDVNIAAVDGLWFTYASQTLYAWDPTTGDLLDSTTLNGAGTDFNSGFGFSYADGYFFVSTNGTWEGYAILGAAPAPEPASLGLLGGALAALGIARRRKG